VDIFVDGRKPQNVLRACIAEDVGHRLIGEQRAAVVVDDDALDRAFRQGAETSLALFQLGAIAVNHP
jgi:hypothetical protein